MREAGSEKEIWWGPVNKEMSPEVSISHLPDRVDDQHMVAGWWPELFSHGEAPLRGAGHYLRQPSTPL